MRFYTQVIYYYRHKSAVLTLKTRSADQNQENTGGKNRLLNVLYDALCVNTSMFDSIESVAIDPIAVIDAMIEILKRRAKSL